MNIPLVDLKVQYKSLKPDIDATMYKDILKRIISSRKTLPKEICVRVLQTLLRCSGNDSVLK